MKRLHVHVGVEDLDASIRFYSQLFAAQPCVRKADYARWMLEDPRVNFAISHRGGPPGVQHLGIQVESRTELAEVSGRLRRAGCPAIEVGETVCCYAQSQTSWIDDPQGISWETFLTTRESNVYGAEHTGSKQTACGRPGCCAPEGIQADRRPTPRPPGA
jgi:catechol 2,3-dioxygenase-like lactoylglutathione lyase family enzyme